MRVEEIGRIGSSRSPGKQELIERGKKKGGEDEKVRKAEKRAVALEKEKKSI